MRKLAAPAIEPAIEPDERAPSVSSSRMAIGVLTLMPAVPAGTRMRSTRPSALASISMVALAVAISASTSPTATLCPSATCQRSMRPSAMEGTSRGIRTSRRRAEVVMHKPRSEAHRVSAARLPWRTRPQC